ncbi:MAG: thiamine pyrophosphate-dependent enzyme, partial [Egibacteraceae bacterium]
RNTRSWPVGVWQFPGAGSYLGHSGGGGVGYGPGAAVGGGLAARDRGQLGVAIIGDGDLLMAPGALWTAVHYQIPLLVVVNNNRSFYNDEEHQQAVARHRGRPEDNAWIGMRVDDPPVDVAGLARSFGAWATGPVTDPDAVAGALAAALNAVDDGRVALIDVHTAPV